MARLQWAELQEVPQWSIGLKRSGVLLAGRAVQRLHLLHSAGGFAEGSSSVCYRSVGRAGQWWRCRGRVHQRSVVCHHRHTCRVFACGVRLAKLGSFDYVMIEASGVAEPLPIAETFTFEDKDDGTEVKDFAMVDTMVSATALLRHCGCIAAALPRAPCGAVSAANGPWLCAVG